MQAAHMLITKANALAASDLMLDFQATLLGIGILHIALHRAEVEQNPGRKGQTAQDIRKHRRPGLRGRKTDTDLAQLCRVRVITGREQRIRQRAQWNTIVEQTKTAANNSVPRFPSRPGKPDSRSNIVLIGIDRL